MGDQRDRKPLPAWKRNPVTAGAMMLLRGYAEPVTTCDSCKRRLDRPDGVIDVRFAGRVASFPCPHCGRTTERRLRVPEAGS